MNEIRFCVKCGKILDDEFLFCPYCGADQGEADEFREILEEPFNEIERMVQTSAMERLKAIEERLEDLETELNGFLLTPRRAG
mgnify:CR=1 FL=1